MNFYNRHIGDYARRTRHLSTYQHGVLSQLLDDYYVSEQGIPKHLVYTLVRASKRSEIKEVNAVLEQFFFLSEDGEAWLNSRAEEEIAAFQQSNSEKESTKSNAIDRVQRCRDGRKALFAQARSLGLHPSFDARINDVREMIANAQSNASSAPETDLKRTCNGFSNVSATANQTPEANHQTPEANQTHTAKASTETLPETDSVCVVTPSETISETLPPVTPLIPPATTPGEVCKALKESGMQSVSPTHPLLVSLLNSGVGIEVFVGAAPDAIKNGSNPFSYLLGTVKNQWQKAKDIKASKPQTRISTTKEKQNEQVEEVA